MTSFALIMGVVSLVLSHGPGAEMRQAIGVAAFSGMLGLTFFGLVLTPVFYALVRALDQRRCRSLRTVDFELQEATWVCVAGNPVRRIFYFATDVARLGGCRWQRKGTVH